ncbi:hypothetical protein Q1695_001840 [Nippostrongylus brasiliensis]|nr:hypothetical protein Q1695_001840 [Nippostrongylus brasiliensis]
MTLAVMASNAPCVALVIKCQPRCDRSLLTVNKRNVFGLFTTSPLPRVGTLIALEFTDCPLEGATIVVSKWSYYPCDPFWQLNVKEVGGVAKFTGSFHTTGCVRYQGVPLNNPAIFNDYIGVVRDEKRVLQQNYIGKLTATVIFVENADEFYWNLVHVDQYCSQIKPVVMERYRGIVHAVGRGPTQTSHFITSRYFPSDVLLRTRRDENIDHIKVLYGREVTFEVGIENLNGTRSFYVIGRPTRAESGLQTIFTDKFISIRTSARFRGARDDYDNLIVWSLELEVIVDSFNLFKDRDHGVYLIDAIRYFERDHFPRWRVHKVHDLVEKLETPSPARQDPEAEQVAPRIAQQKHEDTMSSNRTPTTENCQSLALVNAQQLSSRSPVDVKKDPATKQIAPKIAKQKYGDTNSSNRTPSSGNCQPSTLANDQQLRSSNPPAKVKKDPATKQIAPKVAQQKYGDTNSSNRTPASGNYQPSTLANDQLQRSSNPPAKDPATKQIAPKVAQQGYDYTSKKQQYNKNSNQTPASGNCQPSTHVNDQQQRPLLSSSVSAKKVTFQGSATKPQLPPKPQPRADGERRSDQHSSTDSRQTSTSGIGQHQRSNSSHSSTSTDEKSLRLLFEKCLVDENARNALMQANPDLFESLVDNMMNTD